MVLYIFLKFLHLAGLSVGYGGVLIGAWLSAKSLKDRDFFKSVARIMPTLSFIIWVGVVLLFVSGASLEYFWRLKEIIFEKDILLLFQIKKILAVIIVFHGIYVNLYLSRIMKTLAAKDNPFQDPGFKRFKILGALSAFIYLTLWTSAVILGVWAAASIMF